MIELCHGDILKADVEVLCNPVNCQGVMGKGLALQFKWAYPAMFESYHDTCLASLLKPGEIHVYALPGDANPRYIYNVATKGRFSTSSNMSTVVKGVSWINELMHRHQVTSIAIPALGCGEGRLHWPAVRQVIERMLWPHKHARVLLYPPHEKEG